MNSGSPGLVFSTMVFVALILEPIYGVIQDKLGLKKYLFGFAVLCLLFVGPFVRFAFIPLLQVNTLFGTLVGELSSAFV
ncbi:UNVERIFIED_ORG: oligosaccharide:H+ symporter [Heyndrickxia coagulans]